MARYTQPRLRRVRALGVQLPGLTTKNSETRPYPPGQHGQARRGKASEFALRLREKQKLVFNYGLSEKQMRRIVLEARKTKGNTGEVILSMLERRLDNAVFRAGFAQTIPAARQLVSHGHIRINGKKVDIASYRVRVGEKLTLQDKTKTNPQVMQSLSAPALERPNWLKYDQNSHAIEVLSLPDGDSVPVEVVPSLVVEYYAQRL